MADIESQNIKLIAFFISEFYRKRSLELEHIVSTAFTFKLHNLPAQNFQEFAARMGYISDNAILSIEDIHSSDDTTFVAKSSLSIKRENLPDYVATGLNTFVIKNGLLDKVIVKYDLTDEEFIDLQKLLSANEANNS